MRLNERREDDVEINLTPLIDVVFLLLIFFMVSTTFIHESRIDLSLPEASQDAPEDEPKTIEVDIDRQGRYFINGRMLVNTSKETLRSALREAADGLKEPVLLLKADAQTTHQSVIDVMDAASQIGLNRIRFATRLKQGEGE
ncbi:MAG: biopolymer transporter ExbD [Gammaproteobacteria bacterium]|nr:MAG: biopolymer transporter ExbD [Gammaproteobacteria bacterium]